MTAPCRSFSWARRLAALLPGLLATLAVAGPAPAAQPLRHARQHASTSHHAAGARPRCRGRRPGRRGCRGRRQVLAWTGVGRPPSPIISTAATANCPSAYLLPDQENLNRMRTATLCLVNQQRHAAGLRPLTDSAALDRAARAHSQEMVKVGYFAHLSPAGRTARARVRASGYPLASAALLGENIAWGARSLASPAAVVAEWMSSPAHRALILDPAFRSSGIGVAVGAPEAWDGAGAGTYTQDFVDR